MTSGETSAWCRGLAPSGDVSDVLDMLEASVGDAIAEAHRSECMCQWFECAKCRAWLARSCYVPGDRDNDA